MNYDDIIHKSRPLSKRKKMSMEDRAAQFAPFAALVGYEEAIEETARIVDKRIELDEEAYNLLDYQLKKIQNNIKDKPRVKITYFIKDDKKEGGIYINKDIEIKRIDETLKLIYTTDNDIIEIDDIYEIIGN